MLLNSYDYLHWATGTFLEVLVCGLAIQRRLFSRFPFFAIYVTLVVVKEIIWWWLYHAVGPQTQTAFYFYWVAQGILLGARGLVIAEICLRTLRPYRGLWMLGRDLLVGTALILLFNAGLTTVGSRFWIGQFVLRAERGLELAAVGILVMLLALCRYYGLRLELLDRMVVVGLGFYSGVQVVNNSFIHELLTHYFEWWNETRALSFQVAVVIWCLALRKPLPPERPAPELLSQQIYDELTPQVSFQLRKLNDRLLAILKS